MANRNPKSVSSNTESSALVSEKRSGKVSEHKANRKALRQAIDQGIADYRKQHQSKVRQQDKRLKKAINEAEKTQRLYQDKIKALETTPVEAPARRNSWLPWFLLAISWAGFTLYLTLGASI